MQLLIRDAPVATQLSGEWMLQTCNIIDSCWVMTVKTRPTLMVVVASPRTAEHRASFLDHSRGCIVDRGLDVRTFSDAIS